MHLTRLKVVLDSATYYGVPPRTPLTKIFAHGGPLESASDVVPVSNLQANGNTTTSDAYRPLLLPVSASNEKSLKTRVAELKQYIELKNPSVNDVANTLSSHRVHMSHRTFAISNGTDLPLEFEVVKKINTPLPQVAFVFTGQGAQWVGMGKELCRWMPCFLQDIREMDAVLQGLDEPPLWSIEGMF